VWSRRPFKSREQLQKFLAALREAGIRKLSERLFVPPLGQTLPFADGSPHFRTFSLRYPVSGAYRPMLGFALYGEV
jgi:hypothetical protein